MHQKFHYMLAHKILQITMHIQYKIKERTQNWPDREHNSARIPTFFHFDHEEHERLAYTLGNQNKPLPEGKNHHLQARLPPSQVWQHTKHQRLGSQWHHESCTSGECLNSHAEIWCSKEWTSQGRAQYPPTVLLPWNHIFIRNKPPIRGNDVEKQRETSKIETQMSGWKPQIFFGLGFLLRYHLEAE